MEETPEKKHELLPDWLKRVQENSWEPEILLSGLDPKASEIRIQCVNQHYRLRVNGQFIEHPDWMYYFHQKDWRKGFITFLDVSELTPGRHFLELFRGTNDQNPLAKLVFWKE